MSNMTDDQLHRNDTTIEQKNWLPLLIADFCLFFLPLDF